MALQKGNDYSLEFPQNNLINLKDRPKKVAFISDTHHPFHDKKAMKIVFDILSDYKPEIVILGGDNFDNYQLSFHDKDLDRRISLQDELDVLSKELINPVNSICKNTLYIHGNHECFSDDTEVLTRDGWKLFSSLKKKDLVGCFNINTQSIEYDKPTAIHKYFVNEDLVSIKDKYTDLLITRNHRLLFKHSYSGANWRLKRFNEIEINKANLIFTSSGINLLPDYKVTDNDIRTSDCFPRTEQMPTWVFNLSERQFEIFLETCIDFSGSRRKNRSLVLYGKKAFLDDIQRACLQNGYRTILIEYKSNCYKLNIKKNLYKMFISKKHITNVNYIGNVWCVTTKYDTVIVRRNGKVSITGNSRLVRLVRREPALFNLRSLMFSKMAQLPETWSVYPNQTHIRIGKLLYLHGDLAGRGCGGAYKAGNMLNKLRTSCLFGHWHVMQKHYITEYDGNVKAGFANGHLSDIKQVRYINPCDWQTGFSLVSYSDDMKFYNVEQILILENKAIWRGKLYK